MGFRTPTGGNRKREEGFVNLIERLAACNGTKWSVPSILNEVLPEQRNLSNQVPTVCSLASANDVDAVSTTNSQVLSAEMCVMGSSEIAQEARMCSVSLVVSMDGQCSMST
ncbi:hypothetical protein PI124_g3403 [Phytophthora idaei]|nr:hypothetical protein PI124_g3403 [Phytophthora idaei]